MSSASDVLSPYAVALEIEQSGINPTDRSAFIRAAQAIYRQQRQEGPHQGSNSEGDDSDSISQIPADLVISDTDISREVPSGQMARDAANAPSSNTLATVEGVQTPHVTTTSGETLYHHNLWTNQTATDGTTHEVPSGFRHNTGWDHVPFLIIDKEGAIHQANFVQVILSRDPLVLAIHEGDPHLYGSALHATPYYDGEEYCPRYDVWDLAVLERHYQNARQTDRTVKELNDVTLVTEIEQFRSIMETNRRLDTELERVLKQKHDIGMARERCVIRLEQANALGRIQNLEAEASEVVR